MNSAYFQTYATSQESVCSLSPTSCHWITYRRSSTLLSAPCLASNLATLWVTRIFITLTRNNVIFPLPHRPTPVHTSTQNLLFLDRINLKHVSLRVENIKKNLSIRNNRDQWRFAAEHAQSTLIGRSFFSKTGFALQGPGMRVSITVRLRKAIL